MRQPPSKITRNAGSRHDSRRPGEKTWPPRSKTRIKASHEVYFRFGPTPAANSIYYCRFPWQPAIERNFRWTLSPEGAAMKRLVLTGFLILSTVSIEGRAATGDAALSNYGMAFGLTRAGSFGLAEAAWRNFLSQYSDHPLAGNGQDFLGETFYGRNGYAHAAIAYGIGVEKYPQGGVAPQALLQLGLALRPAGEPNRACAALVRRHRPSPKVIAAVQQPPLVR